MNNPLISFIVPVYNTAEYLHKCIKSILSQRYKNFELLIINDGSTDMSKVICDEYALKESKIRVFHKENGGVSSARNLGLDNAKGQYIFFVDSDDYLLDNALDFVHEDFFTKDIYQFKTYSLYDNVLTNKERYTYEATQTNELWRYFFKMEIINRLSLRFIDIKYGEDYNFIAKYFSMIKTHGFINEFVYVYRKDSPNSAMNKSKDVNYVLDHFILINDLINFIKINSTKVSRKSLIDSIHYAFKMTLVVIAKTINNSSDEKCKIISKYRETYNSGSTLMSLYKFHPFLLKFYIIYYNIRLK